jgi:hypothetical protein
MKINTIPTKKLAIFSAAFGAVMLAFSYNASATPHPLPPVTLATSIMGNIDFVGGVHLDNVNLGSATTVATWFDISQNPGHSTVLIADGSFSGILPGTQADMFNGWVFNPSTATPGLWSVGGFTFDLVSATVMNQSNFFLNVLGSGTIHGIGLDDTPGTWSFTVDNSSGLPHVRFGFAAENNSVPDGGITVALLGIALVGVEVLRRKLKAA